MKMIWHDLLFMHWPVPAAALRPHIPPALTLETFEGAAWLGVVPFRMSGVRPRMVPSLPWLSAFPELNVRTYVTAEGKPGVWFFSLDAANPVAVEAARLGFHLPYYTARMACEGEGEGIRYASERTHRGARPAGLRMRYCPTGPAYRAAPGTLEHWLTARYCLYAADRRGRTWRAEIDHPPWPLQPAEADVEHNTMAEQIGVRQPAPAPLLHFARRLEVAAWLLEGVRR
jgi:uncharacterized protein YqjF (DUF2071 family)